MYHAVPSHIRPKVDPDVAEVVRKYLITNDAGHKQTEMLERRLGATALKGAGERA